MQTAKHLISYLLLFVYSFGFAHYLIPHCDNESDVTHIHTELEPVGHSHHDSDVHEDEADQHKHIQHESHFDEGLYDFLFCFLSGVEHQESTCVLDNYLTKTDSKESRNFNNKFQLLAVLSVLNNPDILSISNQIYTENLDIYVSPIIHLSPNKGPPNYS